jgi:hypothetical protein
MEITGKIVQFLAMQSGQGKNGPWKKQEFILEIPGTYPKKVCIAVWGDKINMQNFKQGDTVDVSFDVESREFNGRWYTDVKAWKVSGSNKQTSGGAENMPPPMDMMPAGNDDDLPF